MKTIVIPGYTYDGFFGMDTSYLHYLSAFGNVKILTPQETEPVEADLLVLPGGKDVNPVRYGDIPGYVLGNPNPYFEYFDTHILPKYIEAGIPVFGICRGLQTLNTHFGGTLFQHLLNHPTTQADMRDELVHAVLPTKDLKGVKKFEVNSLHHQSIRKLGENLTVTLKAEDGVIEAIRHNFLPIAAVQWHPEEIQDAYSNQEIARLLAL